MAALAQRDCGQTTPVWPANLKAFEFFQRIGTRWCVGMSGVTGIRWEAIYPLIDRMGLDGDAWDQMVSDLEVMEQAALGVMNKRD